MPQFFINWLLVDSNQHVSKLKLNNEWSLHCYWINTNRLQKPQFFLLERVSASEEISISGSLIVLDRDTESSQVLQLEQSKKISTRIEVRENFLTIKLNEPILSEIYYLRGEINIVSVIEKNAAGLESKECGCNGLKSLVELSNEFKSLLDPELGCFADVNLKCGDVTIPAHKNILSARSPVFAAMFRNPMTESNKNEVDINDIGLSILRIMLTYIYTGKTSDLTVSSVSSATELLFVADKYQLRDLKRVSCDYLRDKICLGNVLKILVLGDLHCEGLKSSAVDYICNKCTKFSDLEETEEWKTVRRDRPDLAIDVLTSMVKAREEKSLSVV